MCVRYTRAQSTLSRPRVRMNARVRYTRAQPTLSRALRWTNTRAQPTLSTFLQSAQMVTSPFGGTKCALDRAETNNAEPIVL